MTQPALFGDPQEPEQNLPPAKMPWEAPPAPMAVLRAKQRPCTACGAMIVFPYVSRKVKGTDREETKPMPVDVDYDPAGTVHVWLESRGRVLRGHVFGRKADRKGRNTLHKSHFASCPEADRFRQRRGA